MMDTVSELIIISDPTDIKGNFNRWYYASQVWGGQTFYRGIPVQKTPADLWVYQEIIHEVKPRVIIETGTAAGGSAHYLADLLLLTTCGLVLSIDIDPRPKPAHPRIRYFTGDSASHEAYKAAVAVIAAESALCNPPAVLVILDSDHRKEHVLKELTCFSGFVTPGSYLIVEDTNINGHPVTPGWGPGPMEALEQWLPTRKDFSVDLSREKFGLTFNPNGYLRKA